MPVLPRLALVDVLLPVRRRLARLVAVLLALAGVTWLGLAVPAWATPPLASSSQLCEAAIVSAERTGRLPERMMGAIAVVETGRPDPASGTLRPWPWTI